MLQKIGKLFTMRRKAKFDVKFIIYSDGEPVGDFTIRTEALSGNHAKNKLKSTVTISPNSVKRLKP